MGGLGSGQWPRLQKKRVVEDGLDIDVRYLAREGLLLKKHSENFHNAWVTNSRKS